MLLGKINCFSNIITIQLECNTIMNLKLTSGADILYHTQHNEEKEVIIKYNKKNDTILRLVVNDNIYYIVPKKNTHLKISCNNNLAVQFYNKEDILYNKASERNEFRQKNFLLAYKLVYDTTLTVYQIDSIKNVMGQMRTYQDSLESLTILEYAPSEASLYFMEYNFSDRYYNKEYFSNLYYKIIRDKKICKKHSSIINEIGQKLKLPQYTINDTISKSDADFLSLNKNNAKNICLFITGQCHATMPNLLALAEKQARLIRNNVSVHVILSYFDEEIITVCQKNGWQYELKEQFRESDFAYKLWNSSSFLVIHLIDRKIVSMTNNVTDINW